MGWKQSFKRQARQAQPAYLRDVIKLGQALGQGVHEVSVYHDPECDMLNGRGPCNCRPVVRYGPPDHRGVVAHAARGGSFLEP